MTPEELLQHHAEGEHPCAVHEGPSPALRVSCPECGGSMLAALLSRCEGIEGAARVLLVLRCPHDGRTGQLRFAPAHVQIPLHATIEETPRASVCEGGQGYLSTNCTCGGNIGGPVVLAAHGVVRDQLLLHGVSAVCGHPVELAVGRAARFEVAPHWHRAPKGNGVR